MTFAFNFDGMIFFASCVALGASFAVTGCVATDTIEFSSEQNYPPSVVSQQNAEYPLREIGQLNLDESVETELPLEVVVRDPNIDQTLEYRIFLNSTTPPSAEFPILQGDIPPENGLVDRPDTFNIPYTFLVPGRCNKIELIVVGDFAGFVEPRRPAQEGDFDNVTWWVEVTDTDNPLTVGCR